MRGFTLIEVILVLLITTILTSISFYFTALSPETLYLKNFTYKLGSNINLLKDLSLGRKLIDSYKRVCGYGLIFIPTLNEIQYFGYVYATHFIGIECELLASYFPTSFIPGSNPYYIHTNGEIRQNPIDILQMKDIFKKTWSTDYFKISTSSILCDDDLLSTYSQIALVYYNPYGDLLLLGSNTNNNTTQWFDLISSNQDNWDNIYFCLRYKNEERKLRINRSGQIIFENP